MQNQKPTTCIKASEGVSTLDLFKKCRLILTALFLLMLSTASGASAQTVAVRSGHSTLDMLDPTFNAQVSTASYGTKMVRTIVPLSDGKILVGGKFNSYNGAAIGGLVRLQADGSLDTSFNSNLVIEDQLSDNGIHCIVPLSDGKILIAGNFAIEGETARRGLARLNADGTLDASFAYQVAPTSIVTRVLVRPNGKIVLSGDIWSTPNGSKSIVQLNPDGTFDTSFALAGTLRVRELALQGDKVLWVHDEFRLCRLNEDGSPDASFPCRNYFLLNRILVQPSRKIVIQSAGSTSVSRLNEDGSDDQTFNNAVTTAGGFRLGMQENGSLIVVEGSQLPLTIIRLSPDGIRDTSFSTYVHQAFVYSLAVQADGKVLLGDSMFGGNLPQNNFVRLSAGGGLDASFNPGGGFQFMNPGKVRTIAVQPDNKILVAGKFDLINSTSRNQMARLNQDGTLDHSFQISTTGANRFLSIGDIYNVAYQSDGKILVTGVFRYVVNEVTKQDFVRLNADGSIDSTFNLNVMIINVASVNLAGTNRMLVRPDDKILIGTSQTNYPSPEFVPIKLNADGSRDTSFNPTLLNSSNSLYVYDLFVQPDGKIVVGGSRREGAFDRSYVVRLNDDGSLDSSFQVSEETGQTVKSLALLPRGKMLVAKTSPRPPDEQLGQVVRLNAVGSPDATFNSGAVANGRVNAILVLPNGKILVGGKFTQFNNQPRQNLALLKADGDLDTSPVNVNQEVLSLTLDNQERILVGGAFTTINAGGGYAPRTYIARLLAATPAALTRTRFDFDGDRRADLAVFDPSNGVWSIRSSSNNQTVTTRFGQTGDITAPADFDGDGRTDIAVYRPAEGVWYLLQSNAGFTAVRWGAPGDKPVAGDFDGDGRADIAVWRPSNGTWYIRQSKSGLLRAVRFGQAGDVVLREVDFDGDGRDDIAVYRPSNGGWYWLASGANDQFKAMLFGQDGDLAAAADYNADGKTDLAVFRPTNGVWYRQLSTSNGGYTFSALPFGVSGDVPVVADYNGDGAADISLRRGDFWHLLLSTQGHTGASFGRADEQAVAATGQP